VNGGVAGGPRTAERTYEVRDDCAVAYPGNDAAAQGAWVGTIGSNLQRSARPWFVRGVRSGVSDRDHEVGVSREFEGKGER
jgi:hypothetical protein